MISFKQTVKHPGNLFFNRPGQHPNKDPRNTCLTPPSNATELPKKPPQR